MRSSASFLCVLLFIMISEFLCSFQHANGQTLKELERARENNRREIEYADKLLKETLTKKRNTLNTLSLYKKREANRRALIKSLNREIQNINYRIAGLNISIDKNQKTLDELKDQYKKIINYLYKRKSEYDNLMFILASEDINQSFRRIKHMKEYAKNRRQTAEKIKNKNEELGKQRNEMMQNLKKKEDLVKIKEKEIVSINNERNGQNKLYAQLKNREKELKSELDAKRRIGRSLESSISDIISSERESRGAGEGSMFKLTPEDKILSENFGQNKGKMPWPMMRGVVVSSYGKHRHPVLSKVMVDNHGIDISTESNMAVRSVFEGVVSKVIQIPGANIAVIIRHGEFFSVYQNLKEVVVKKGDYVGLKEKIGIIFTDDSKGESILHFEIWSGKNRTNPEIWLSKSYGK